MSFTSYLPRPASLARFHFRWSAPFRSGVSPARRPADDDTTRILRGSSRDDRAVRAALARGRRPTRPNREIAADVAEATRELALLRIGIPR